MMRTCLNPCRRVPFALACAFVGVLGLSGTSSKVSAAELRVPSADAPTIGAALRGAANGDRILVTPGTYRERLLISKGVALLAAPGESRPVIDGGGEGHVIEVAGASVTVQGLELRGSGDRLEHSDACIYVRKSATGARLLDNRLGDCAFGIWVNGTTGVEVARNVVRGRPRPIFSDRGNGLNLWEIREGNIHDNDIAQVRDGIYLSVTTDSVVADNRMRDLRFGVHYMYSDHNRVVGNVTCDSQVGLALMFSKRLEIRGNAALRNREHGILFRSILDSRIEDNRVEGNNKGFFLNDASFNEIHGNWVADNAIGVHVTGGSENNRVTRNAFVHNHVQVRFAWNYPVHWDDGQAGNYWSDYLGWDLDGDRIGDRSYYAAGGMDRLMFRYPGLKVLASSPVVTLMQTLEARFPVLRPPSIVDSRPAMNAPVLHGIAAPGQSTDALCGSAASTAHASSKEAS